MSLSWKLIMWQDAGTKLFLYMLKTVWMCVCVRGRVGGGLWQVGGSHLFPAPPQNAANSTSCCKKYPQHIIWPCLNAAGKRSLKLWSCVCSDRSIDWLVSVWCHNCIFPEVSESISGNDTSLVPVTWLREDVGYRLKLWNTLLSGCSALPGVRNLIKIS